MFSAEDNEARTVSSVCSHPYIEGVLAMKPCGEAVDHPTARMLALCYFRGRDSTWKVGGAENDHGEN